MKRSTHKWMFDLSWDDTEVGKRLQGFSRCVNCGLMRFRRAGFPPQSAYVLRKTLLETPDLVTWKNKVDVFHLAPPCGKLPQHESVTQRMKP